MTKVTVIIPTFNHHDMIVRAIASVRRQTVQDYEVFIIGDGVSDQTRELVAQICEEDDRFRFFDNPKSLRTGEPYRHNALKEAKGKVVCYLADDDLWLPNHLETMLEASGNADFFHSLHVGVHPKVGLYLMPSNLEDGVVRTLMCETKANRFGLSFCGHTLAGYRALPHGWRTTPDGLPTDLYMWRQFLLQPQIRAKTIFKATTLNFAAGSRQGWSHQQRLQELDQWLSKIDGVDFQKELTESLIAYAAKKYVALDMLKGLGLLKISENPWNIGFT